MRNAFLRRVTTRWAASSLARAASERKSGFGVSCSKYSTRHGHQSASISDFGNCIRSFKLDARLQIVRAKSSRLFAAATPVRTTAIQGERNVFDTAPLPRILGVASARVRGVAEGFR